MNYISESKSFQNRTFDLSVSPVKLTKPFDPNHSTSRVSQEYRYIYDDHTRLLPQHLHYLVAVLYGHVNSIEGGLKQLGLGKESVRPTPVVKVSAAYLQYIWGHFDWVCLALFKS